MAEILYSPDRERLVTTNAWAFLHWARTARGVQLPGWVALQRWSAEAPAAFSAVVAAFARLPADAPPSLIRGAAEALLLADLRPDDQVVVLGPARPWLAAQRDGTAFFPASGDPLAATARVQGSVLIAPAQVLAEAAFRRAERPDLSSLRTIVATGGPLSPEGRRRIYTWIKRDLMLLARTGDTYWGNPLDPVLARPAASPAFLMPPALTPAPR